MSTANIPETREGFKIDVSSDLIRQELVDHVKSFKTSWVNLGQALYPVWKDKFFYTWGYDKFEDYVQRELGMQKSTALKLLKTYFFIEQEEPDYLKKDFSEQRDAIQVPGCDEVNVLRLARQKKELTRDDYNELKQSVFEKGKNAGAVRKDLVSMMKERKPVDPEEERENRNEASLKKLVNALRSFEADMEVLKLAPAELLEEAKALLGKLEEQIV